MQTQQQIRLLVMWCENGGEKRNMAKNEFSKMTPEERSYWGKIGAQKSKETKRKRKEMRETLDVLLKMPMRKGKVYTAEDIKCFADLKGKNITIDQAVMVCLIQKALKGDLNAIAMVRDTVGEKPSDKVEVKDVTPVIISGEDELSE